MVRRCCEISKYLWILLLAGCLVSDPPAPEPAIDGEWSLTSSALASTCPVEGSLFPVPPGLTRIRRGDDAVELTPTEAEPLSYVVDGDRWRRSRTVTVGRCSADVSEIWSIHSVSGHRLSATCSVVIDVRGECAPYESCRVDYGVWGVQP